MKQKIKVVLYFASVILPLLDIVKGIKRGVALARVESALAKDRYIKESVLWK